MKQITLAAFILILPLIASTGAVFGVEMSGEAGWCWSLIFELKIADIADGKVIDLLRESVRGGGMHRHG